MRMTSFVPLCWVLATLTLSAQEPPASALGAAAPNPPQRGPVTIHKLQYTGTVSEKEARFTASIQVECTNKVETVLPLFSGDIAVLGKDLPAGLRLDRAGKGYLLAVTQPGEYQVELEILARIKETDPLREVEFGGPVATISTLQAQVAGNGLELEMLSGTAQPREGADKSKVSGVVGADKRVALRWQSKTTRQERPALLTANTASTILITPTVIKYSSVYNYEILQGKPTNVVLTFPAGQTLTSLKTDMPIRDRRIDVAGGRQTLTLDFIKPMERAAQVTLLTEQPAESNATVLVPPQPEGVEREQGQVSVQAEDVKVETTALVGLRQVDTAAGMVGAWQFFSRNPFTLGVSLTRIAPVINVHDTVNVSVEEKRTVITHTVDLNVEKAGIYALELAHAADLRITQLSGNGVADWKLEAGKVQVKFATRVRGAQQFTVLLERMSDKAPERVAIAPLRVTGAARQTADISVSATRGFEIKTGALTGLRESPASGALAYSSIAADWDLAVTLRRLSARIVASVANGVVIGENRITGFAKIYYAISDQGVQQFQVRVPAAWENVQLVGNKKRREIAREPVEGGNATLFTFILQEEVWNQFTLQVSYDMPMSAQLSLRGAHPLSVERESGLLMIHSAANVGVQTKATLGLTRIDQSELDEAERARISHPLLYAFKYETAKNIQVDVSIDPHREESMQNAVADYTALTTIVTSTGERATAASLSVKKTDKENPRFRLPPGAQFKSAKVDDRLVTPSIEGDTYIIPLPEDAGVSQTFQVLISYTEAGPALKHTGLAGLQENELFLQGPTSTNIPNTFSRWTVYVPQTHEMYEFDGSMVPAQKPAYTWTLVLEKLLGRFRGVAWGGVVLVAAAAVVLLLILNVFLRRGWRSGLLATGAVAGTLALLFAITQLTLGGKSTRGDYAVGWAYPAAKEVAEKSKMATPTDDMGPDSSGGSGRRQNDLSKDAKSDEQLDRTAQYKSREPSQSKSEGPSAQPKTPPPVLTPSPANPPPARDLPVAGNKPKGGPGGGGFGGGGGMGGVPGTGLPGRTTVSRAGENPADPNMPAPEQGQPSERTEILVAGILPTDFEIPTDGRAYVFTKALNSDRESLSIKARIMNTDQLRTRRSLLHLLLVAGGLVVLILELRRHERNSLWITGGLALALGGVGAHSFARGTLHDVLFTIPWVLAVCVFVWAAWYYWPPRRIAPPPSPAPPAPLAGGSTAGAATVAALLLSLGLGGAAWAQPAPALPTDAKAWENLQHLLRLLADPDILLQRPGGPRVIRESQLQDRNGTAHEMNQDEPYTGVVVGFYQNQQKRIESHYQAGHLHGTETTWFEHGQRQRQTPWQQGRIQGEQTTWHRNGQKESTADYAQGRRHGLYRAWHPDGKLREETPHQEGEAHGLSRHWHPNGKIAREVRWESGRQLSFDTWTAEGVRFGEGTNTVTLTAANYKITVHREVALVTAELKLTVRAPKQKFPLFNELMAVDEFNSTQPGVRLLREGAGMVLLLPEAGAAGVRLKFLVRHDGDATRRTLGFAIPSALVSDVDAVLTEADSEVEMPTAVKLETSSGGNQTLVDAIIGASDRLELSWKPRVKKAKEIAASVFVENASLVTFGNGVVQTRTTLHYQVSEGELRTAQAALPAGWKLMQVNGGKSLRNYFVETVDGKSILTVELTTGVTGTYSIELALEQPMPAPPASVPFAFAHAHNVKREIGMVGVQSFDELGLTFTAADRLIQVDAAEFAREAKLATSGRVTTWRFLQPVFTLVARLETILPELEATARHVTAIYEDRLQVSSQVDYQIKRAGVFQFRLRLPDDAKYRVDRVSGPNNPQWEERVESNARLLLVTLSQRTLGAYPLRVDLSQQMAGLPENVAASGVHPLGLKKLTTYVGIFAEPGVEVQEKAAKELNKWTAALFAGAPNAAEGGPTIPASANPLAYRNLTDAPGAQPSWSLSVATRALDPWVRTAQVVSWVRVGQTRVHGRSQVRYPVEHAPTRRFMVRVPKLFNNTTLNVTGAGIRRKDSNTTDAGHVWTIELQNKVPVGQTFVLNLEWEYVQWSTDKNQPLEFSGPTAQGKNLHPGQVAVDPQVEGEEGWVIVGDDARAKLNIQAQSVENLDKKSSADLPEWTLDAANQSARLVYYYRLAGHTLMMSVKPLASASVEQARVRRAELASVVTADGQMMTRMELEIDNTSKQFLALTLPKDAKAVVWSVFVNGQARRPTKDSSGSFLIPLDPCGDMGSVPVDVVYTSRIGFPSSSGRVHIAAPKLDIQLSNAQWRFYLPEDFAYSRFTGSMDNKPQQSRIRKYAEGGESSHRVHANAPEGGDTDGLTIVTATTVASGKSDTYSYSRQQYAQQESDNAKKLLENVEKQQLQADQNLQTGKLSSVNQFAGQASRSLNDLRNSVDARDAEYNGRLMKLEAAQKEFDKKRREAQVQREQSAAEAFSNRRNPGNNESGFGANQPPQNPSEGQPQGQAAAVAPATFDAEEALRQVDEIERIQQRVSARVVVPLRINLPQQGRVEDFMQPLNNNINEAMTVEFHALNTERPDWITAALCVAGVLAGIFCLVNLARRGLRRPARV